MNLHHIHTIARYEVKLLKRSWLFRIFAVLAVLFLTFLQFQFLTRTIFKQTATWDFVGLTSLIPFFTVNFYNIAQAVVVIFLAGGFLKRDKKMDTAEVIYVRPMSNADYIAGKVWGITRVFLGLHLIPLLFGLLINLWVSQSPFSIFPYVFYLFTLSLPTLLFVLGLSYICMCLLKNQAVVFVLMLGFTAVAFFFLPDKLYGIFDFFGAHIPSVFSDYLGQADPASFLLQRLTYLLFGFGFLLFTVVLLKRLPHRPWKTRLLTAVAIVLLLSACVTAWLYVRRYEKRELIRREYAEVYKRYASHPGVSVVSNDIRISVTGGVLTGESRLLLKNHTGETMPDVVLYLNPSLEVYSIESEGGHCDFFREKQAVVLSGEFSPGEEWGVTLKYGGGIDEYICYTDIAATDFFASPPASSIFRYGKRYAYLEEKLVLLTPESLWYPVGTPPVNPENPYSLRKDFTSYTLRLSPTTYGTVISQGEQERLENGELLFRPEYPLPGISLTMGDYEKKELRVDSVNYEMYYFRGHDFFSGYFSELRDTLPAILTELRSSYEVNKNRTYPFRRFTVIETPVHYSGYLRNWKGHSEQVGPGYVYLPERGLNTGADFESSYQIWKMWYTRGRVMDDREIMAEVLKDYLNRLFFQEMSADWLKPEEVNVYNISPMFFGFTGYIRSEEFPVFDLALHVMQSMSGATAAPWNWWMLNGMTNQQRAILYLQEHSFNEALTDRSLKPEVLYEVLKLKADYLACYIYSNLTESGFRDFMKMFYARHRFSETGLPVFVRELFDYSGMDLNVILDEWFNLPFSPYIRLQDVDVSRVLLHDFTKYQLRFKAYNASAATGVLKVNVENTDNRSKWGRSGSNARVQSAKTDYYILPPHSAREIRMISDEEPSRLLVNTSVSSNLPNEFSTAFSKIERETRDTLQGIFPIDSVWFVSDHQDIIVDNEDAAFRVTHGNQKQVLQRFFDRTTDKYKSYTPWRTPSKWTFIIHNTCYGAPVASAVHKKKGEGSSKAEWSAEIPQDGYYEVSVWVPKLISGGGRRSRYSQENMHTYTIHSPDGDETLSLDMNRDEAGWVSLGTFYFPAGDVRVSLSDRVTGTVVIADALKFTRKVR